jgi:hypothetical protein
MRRSFKRRPVCVCCRGRLLNLDFHVCDHCERRHGPFRFRRMGGATTPDWYWADPVKADPRLGVAV